MLSLLLLGSCAIRNRASRFFSIRLIPEKASYILIWRPILSRILLSLIKSPPNPCKMLNYNNLLAIKNMLWLFPASEYGKQHYPPEKVSPLLSSNVTTIMKINTATLLFCCLSLLGFAQGPATPDIKINAPLLNKLKGGGQHAILIRFDAQADVSAARHMASKEARGTFVYQETQRIAQESQAAVRQLLESAGTPYQPFHVVNAIACKADYSLAQQLARRPEVRELQDNAPVQLQYFPAPQEADALDFRNGVEWGIAAIGADQVWQQGFTGQGVVIGGQDTGYEWAHPAIKDSYRGWDGTTADHNYNWHDAIHAIDSLNGPPYDSAANPCGLDSPVPCDDNNHGTHTMGTMAGGLSDEGKSIGVAPGARWIACRNMERGYGSPSSYIECFEWFLAPTDLNGENPDPTMAPHVIANSWSCPEIEGCNPSNFSIMQAVVDNLKAAGVVVVVSAGNSGSSCGSVSTPAAIFENSFTVGATQQNDTIAGFSSRGTVLADNSNRLKPNVAAPGVGVRSSIRNGGFATFSGTSMAGPHVAGAVALIISARPDLAGQVEVIESLLEQTARPMQSGQDCGGVSGMDIPNAVYGFGRIDALQAVEAALNLSSVKEAKAQTADITPFPNPSAGLFRLQANFTPASSGTARVFNVAGLPILEAAWPAGDPTLLLNGESLAPGIYYFEVWIENRRFTGKLIRH